ncbi:hypothetical protein EVAR_72610_1 [Eumeta japonica]|uniref:RNA-directed DNA polymerase from transposon BS n=1 Tax=Eumeta variegata TaxID=151549 RepID=A0A4C1TCM2_EUMVA|nr:hypothetical protein EVAR_72610_1 [Eumeta japonica]
MEIGIDDSKIGRRSGNADGGENLNYFVLRNKELEFVNSTVFLGITLDDRLQWGPHISKLAKRLSSAAYAVKKMRNLSDVETARLIYFGCFHSLMSYGILFWENGYSENFRAAEAGRSRNLQARTSYIP